MRASSWVKASKAGDYSSYTLRLVKNVKDTQPPDGFDPLLSSIDFSFKIDCPSDFDCAQKAVCIPERFKKPDINYLAKDYATFRRLMLDRLSVLLPGWKERKPADLQVALVELLAYTGDLLSYQQDAIATEAYLGTARKRISVRRHARLVDYFMHDGCNARAWVQIQVSANTKDPLTLGTKLLTRLPGQAVRIGEKTAEYEQDEELKEFSKEINITETKVDETVRKKLEQEVDESVSLTSEDLVLTESEEFESLINKIPEPDKTNIPDQIEIESQLVNSGIEKEIVQEMIRDFVREEKKQ